MTAEQINRDAENFAYNESDGLTIMYWPYYRGYIVGAHRRDNEVEMLQNHIEALSDQLKMNAEYIQKIQEISNPQYKTSEKWEE